MMEEGLQVIKARWRDEQATFHGQYYQVDQERSEARRAPLPLFMISGDGEQLMLRAVARYADWWNCYSRTPTSHAINSTSSRHTVQRKDVMLPAVARRGPAPC